MATGARSELIGICGGRTITTKLAAGSGLVVIGVSVDTNTASALTRGGTVVAGSTFATCGHCGERIDSTTVCMAAHAGLGVATSALAYTCTAIATCGGITRGIGVAFAHTGTCGSGITTTNHIDGSGAEPSVLAATCIVCVSFVDGLVQSGSASARIGTCTARTITTTVSMDADNGVGVALSALECIVTACAPCMSTCRVAGSACGPIGTCTAAITTTSATASTCTVSALSGATAKGIGDVCEHTGTCGSETITTRLAVGSGAEPSVLAVISTVSEYSAGGLEVVGSRFANTGTCTARTITIMPTMAACSGDGAVTSALVSIATACAPSIAMFRVGGSVCAHTGICGGGTTSTRLQNGNGGVSSVLATICTVSAF